MSARRNLHIAAVALLGILALPGFGQSQHPNLERGFSAEKAYDFTGVDDIGLFDGSLMATLPIGPEFHVNGRVSYSLKLTYNNQIWDLDPGQIMIWPDEYPEPIFIPYVDAWPTRRSNAGVGWLLTLGKLFPDASAWNSTNEWVYESPDGADHSVGQLGVGGVGYSKDGTFIRSKRPLSTRVTLEFPDGNIHTFDRYTADDWRLTEIRDPFGNKMTVSYAANGDWTIKDDHTGREIDVYFIPKSYYNAYNSSFIDRVVLKGVGGAARVYQFNYTSASYHTSCDFKTGRYAPTNFTSPFLTSIDLPDGTRWEMKYSNSIGTAQTNCDQGSMTSLKLPTHGTIQWAYVNYGVPTDQCSGYFRGLANVVPGVGTRTLLDENLANGGRITTYTPGLSSTQTSGCAASRPSEYVTTTVRMPDGARTVHYYSVWDDGRPSPNGHQAFERGLPYRRLPDGRKLSEEFLGTCSGTNCPALRSTYVNWEFERTNTEPIYLHHNSRLQFTKTVYNDDANHYFQKFWTDYDGVGHYRGVVTSSDIGGTDRYETTAYDATTGTMIVDAKGLTYSDVVSRPGVNDPWILGTYSYKSATEGDTSLMSTFCFEKSTGFLQRERVTLDANGGSGLQDVLKVYAYTLADGDPAQNGKGNLLREEDYGGDDQNMDPGAIACGSNPPSPPRYTILHQYDFGTRKSSKYKNTTFNILDLTVDPYTGLPTEERDTNGVLTTYAYDELWRLKETQKSGRAKMQFLYNTPASPSQVTAQALDPATSAVLTDTRIYYDAFGRMIQMREKMPAGWATLNTTYDAAGHKSTVSSPEYRTAETYEPASAFSPAHVTTYTYDPYGRIAGVTGPDNSQTTYSYVGDRQSTSTHYVTADFGQPDQAVTTTSDFDLQKRLVRIAEKSGPPNTVWPLGTEVTTNYGYDVSNHLISVKMTAADGVVQNRIFNYDGRGFLRWESHPETGMTAYTYDARGNVVTKRQGAADTFFDLNYQYDPAERLTRIEGRNPDSPAQFRVLKEYEFGDANVGTDLRQGKVVRGTRYNYKPAGFGFYYPPYVVRVTQTYGYNEPGGEKTDRTTTIGSSWDGTTFQDARGISQSVSYDLLGLRSTVKYPMCVNCGTPPGDPWREITPTYSNGFMTALQEPQQPGNPPSVPSFVSGISYAANGMRTAINHTNTIVDTRTPDPSGIPRPAMMKSETYKPCSAPLITSLPTGVIRTTAQGTVRLQVTATGSPQLSYAWYDSTVYPATLIGTGTYVDVAPTSTHTYYVEVTNDCRTVRSNTITVKYGDCVDAWIYTATATRNSNGTYTLSATAFGTGTLNYTWQSVPDNNVVATTQSFTTGVLTSTFAQYRVTVTNGCGGAGASTIVYVSVPISVVPMTINASRSGTSQITISWSSVSAASSYELDRRDINGNWTSIATGNITQYNDTGLAADTAYAYRALAVDSYNDTLGQSPVDVATTFNFTDVTANTPITADPFNELLRALNGVRALSGWASVGWNNILSPSDPLPDPGSRVIARHVLALRARLNEAMQAVGVPSNGYADSDVQGLAIQAAHLTELQNRLR